jgi:tetratricopeptide (TPR) repeat protein
MLRLWVVALGVPAILALASPLARQLGWGRMPPAIGSLAGPARLALAVVLASWILLLLFLPTLASWYGWRFRYFAWTAVRLFARTSTWLARGTVLGVLLLAIWWQRDQLLQPRKVPWLSLLGEGTTAAILMAMVAGVYLARSSIMILPFEDYTGDPALAAAIKGLAASLRTELAAIAIVYRVIDEAWSNPQGRTDLMPRVEQIGDSLHSAVAPDAKVSFGFVQIPLGAMMALFSRLFRGPRLTVSVHRQGSAIVLIAELQGGGHAGSWKADPADMDDLGTPAPGSSPLPLLVEQLAFRLATDLVPIGSPRWRAVRDYTRGLSTYRATQRTRRDRNLLLRRAEQCFLRARNEDGRFAQCHYNLAVIYSQLGQPESAVAALRTALREGHASGEVSHALAVACFQSQMYDEAIRVCDNALRKEAWRGEIWAIKAFALRARRTRQLGYTPPPSDEVWKSVVEHREIATALAWRALCRSRLRGAKEQRTLEEAARCLVSLGVGYAQIQSFESFRYSAVLLHQALHLAPDDRAAYLELPKVLTAAGRWRPALDALDGAIDDELDTGKVAALRTCALACNVALYGRSRESAYETAAQVAFSRLLDCLAEDPDQTLEPLNFVDSRQVDVDEYRIRLLAGRALLDLLRAGEGDAPGGGMEAIQRERQRLDHIAAGIAGLQRAAGEPVADYLRRLQNAAPPPALESDRGARGEGVDELQTLRAGWAAWALKVEQAEAGATRARGSGSREESLDTKLGSLAVDWAWAGDQLRIRRADLTPMENPEAAARALEEALLPLEQRGSSLVRSLGLHLRLADLYRVIAARAGSNGRAHLISALRHAEAAVASHPLGSWERRLLGETYFALADYGRAEDEWLRCLDLDPDNAETVRSIARLYWNLGVFASTPDFRRAAFEKVIERLTRAVSLLESERLGASDPASQLESRGWMHHYLGVFHAEILQFENGIRHQRIAQAMGFKPIHTRVALAVVYYEARAFDQAERELRGAVIEARRQSRGRGTLGPAAAPGEETPINELLVTAYVVWAMLLAEVGADLVRADRLIRFAKRRIRRFKLSQRPAFTEVTLTEQRMLRSWFHEACGAVQFARHDLQGSMEQVERSLALNPSSRPWLLLARVCLAAGRDGSLDPEAARERARAAVSHARESDLRGLFAAELAEIETRLG